MENVAHEKFVTLSESELFKSMRENDLLKLRSYLKLMEIIPERSSSLTKCTCYLVIVLAASLLIPVTLFALVHHGIFSEVEILQNAHRTFSRMIVENYMEFDLEREQCILETLEGVEDIFRPPITCSICQNVTTVERLSGISVAEFEENFAYSSRPVVITDAMNDWTAVDKFSFEYLKSVYHNDSPALTRATSDCQFFPYKTNFGSLKDVFAMSSDRARLKDGSKPWYIGWSNCDSLAANTLRQHYSRPYFLPSESESSRTDWIFMGTPGYGAPMHIDNVGLPSWQAQVKGTKRWFLEPPPECYLQCTFLEAVVSPGEIIVLDTNRWFHQTLIEGDDLSITIGSEYD